MNLIPKICELLGVEIGEKFKVTRYNNVVFRFDETSLQFFASLTNEWKEVSDEFYKIMMKGDTEVERLPFEPKEGEKYWVATWDTQETILTTCGAIWHNRADCYADKYVGNCFRTEVEAEWNKYEIYEKLTGRKWEEK